jgi:hypothetical protein
VGVPATDGISALQARHRKYMATYDLRWTNYVFSVFSRYKHQDRVLHFYGDDAETQNGFGN